MAAGTRKRLREAASASSAAAVVGTAVSNDSSGGIFTRAKRSRIAAMLDAAAAANGSGSGSGSGSTIVQIHARTAGGCMVPAARTPPLPAITVEWLARAAGLSVNEATGRGFLTLWRDIREGPCTEGLGTYDRMLHTVFRVCTPRAATSSSSEDNCDACVAVKFGLVMNYKGLAVKALEGIMGRADLEELETAPDTMRGLSPHEVRNTRLVTAAVLASGATPHVVQYIDSVTWPQHNSQFLFLEYLPPVGHFPRLATLGDLTRGSNNHTWRRMTDVQWRGLVFQMIWTLAALQAAIPGFRHNDALDNNWALMDGTPYTDATYAVTSAATGVKLGAWRLAAPLFWPKLLDYALAHSTAGTPSSGVYSPVVASGSLAAQGIVPTACDYADVFTLLHDLRHSQLWYGADRDRVKWDVSAFAEFAIDSFPIEVQRRDGKNVMAATSIDDEAPWRLTVAGQRLLARLEGTPRAAKTPLAMLANPYFDVLRVPPATVSEAYCIAAP